ncbi:MAG: hypothetical protein MUF45_08905 [Spirosomaceae bacterium]|nr:hypothetical protein [Spirosomataceae bacterium]
MNITPKVQSAVTVVVATEVRRVKVLTEALGDWLAIRFRYNHKPRDTKFIRSRKEITQKTANP